MQLAYVWIEKSKSGFIENTGINFFGEHCFELKKYNNELFKLTYKRLDIIGAEIFKDKVVKNITAIVGENGSGKTSFIEELKLLSNTENDSLFLQVFKVDDTFYYNTNIPEEKIKLVKGIRKSALRETNMSIILISNSSYINNSTLWDYTSSGIRKSGERFFELLFRIDRFKKKETLAGERLKHENMDLNYQYEFLEHLYNRKEVNLSERFQSICDLLFYYEIFLEEKNFLGKRELEISFEINKYENEQFDWLPIVNLFIERNVADYCGLAQKLYSNLIIELLYERFFEKDSGTYYFYVFQEREIILDLLNSNNIDYKILEIFMFYLATNDKFIEECDKQIEEVNHETILKINTNIGEDKYTINDIEEEELFDLIDYKLQSGKLNNEEEDIFKKYYKNIIIDESDDYASIIEVLDVTEFKILDLNRTINKCFEEFFLIYNAIKKDVDQIFNLIMALNQDRTTLEMKKYFSDAIIEIKKFFEITKNSISFKISAKDGKDLMEFINNKIFSIETEPSFVLRHIMKINGLEMSSGERAVTNLFSWIYAMPKFSKINPKEKFKKSIMIIIDEIDLYVHPEWQRRLVKVLCESVNSIFEHHRVQIILTTHSPFVLSDIPSKNIIYLKSKNDKFNIEQNDVKTFGANIHKLLKNSFFMESTMGEFSKSIILEINEALNATECLSEADYKIYGHVIEDIGEPIIRKHLSEKLKRKLPKYQRIADLEAEIARLQGEINDKN